MLTINESYIFDHFENIQYYWNDIEEVVTTNAALDIRLYKPAKYFPKIRNPFWRVITKIKYNRFNAKSLYKIDLNMLDIKKGENEKFLQILNEYSLSSS